MTWATQMKAKTIAFALSLSTFCAAAPLTVQDYLKLSGREPDQHIAYGTGPSQFAELFLPKTKGPFPVTIIIHGGCWTVQFGGITQMRAMAEYLADRGIAAWNVEYRRCDEEGGGYPGMYQDIASAVDLLKRQAPLHNLDLTRVVAVGHSAGGHLAQWAASRHKLPTWSPIYAVDPLSIPAVISLGGLADLKNDATLIKQSCDREIAQLAGTSSETRPDIFADTSPAQMLPSGVLTILIHGEDDDIAPPTVGDNFAKRSRAAGDEVEMIVLPSSSHYDEVAPHAKVWSTVFDKIRAIISE